MGSLAAYLAPELTAADMDLPFTAPLLTEAEGFPHLIKQAGTLTKEKNLIHVPAAADNAGNKSPIHTTHSLSELSFMQIFLPCSHPAPDMPFRLVHIQYNPRLRGKRRVDLG